MTRYCIGGVVPVLLGVNGGAGTWSGENGRARFARLELEQVALLVQFIRPSTADEAFERAGLSPGLGAMLLRPLLSQGLVREHVEGDAPYHRLRDVSADGRVTFVADADAFSPDDCGAVVQRVLASGLVGPNPLSDAFADTSGFGVTFRRAALPRVLEWFPMFAPFLERVIRSEVYAAFAPAPEPDPVGEANAFYLNTLVIPAGAGTDRHVDVSLGAPAQLVSVLYLQAAERDDGQLHLFEDQRLVGAINPRVGMLVHFRGDLAHGVAARSPDVTGDRISVICEHYALTPAQLARCPFLEIARR